MSNSSINTTSPADDPTDDDANDDVSSEQSMTTATDQRSSKEHVDANDPRRNATPQSEDGSALSEDLVPIVDLLEREADLAFAGLTPKDDHEYPDDVSPETRCFDDSPRSFKEIISVLPTASGGELWATNEFVNTRGDVDLDTLRQIQGLDIDALENATGRSLEEIAAAADSEPIVPVRDHKDIVDERRKALNALGYDVKFRWQIASDSYAIINPQEAYLPIIGALQRRGENNAFGWVSYRDWGGLLKMFVICPGLRHTISSETDENEGEVEQTNGTVVDQEGTRGNGAGNDGEMVVYGGFETGYDFRGTQTLWAKPILFFPDSGTVLPDTGERYTRRHYGKATDAAHERANDRVPINEWWKSIYDDIDIRMVTVDRAVRQARAIAYDFEDLPFDAETCYEYWGIAHTYAEAAADRATTLANPSTRPTVFNLQLSLLIALLDHYEGSMASNTYQEYLEVAGELLRKPSMMIQLAVKEHDRQSDGETERVLSDDQQTLSDALEDIVDIPGIEVDTEIDLSDQQAQRLHDRVQRTFDDLG